MARGIGTIEGWPAVAWIASMGAALIVTAAIVWLRSRSLRDQLGELPTYRSAGAPATRVASNVRALALILVLLCAVSQLLYAGLYVELVQWLLGARERPSISGDLFFWVLLVTGTCAGASLHSAWKGDA